MKKRQKRVLSKGGVVSRLLAKSHFPTVDDSNDKHPVKKLQLKMLRIQQGVWHSRKRAIILFEGFDAAGKGGAIRRLTEMLDPRGLRVHPIGPPTDSEQGKHYLYRFWCNLPEPGAIAIFDRSWYGRVLVERVEGLTKKRRWKEAYAEINQFEAMLVRDGIDLVKIFLVIHAEEQLLRYTDTRIAPWHLVPADSKEFARNEVLEIVTSALAHHGEWMESLAQKKEHHELRQALKQIKKVRRSRE